MTEKRTYAKSTCCISGCPKWTRKYPPGQEWICARHWRSTSRTRRALLRKVSRWIDSRRADFEANPAIAAGPVLDEYRSRWRLERRLWDAIRREATLKAAGL